MKAKLLFITTLLFLLSCGKDDDEETPVPTSPTAESPVVFDIDAVPYGSLSTYHFFDGDMSLQEPAMGVLPYDLNSTLFTDYAKKKRFIWMPPGKQAQFVSDHEVLDFEDETVIIKTFYYDNVQPSGNTQIIETRLMYKKNGVWQFADYVWNDEQTEAYLDNNGSHTSINWIDDFGTLRNVNYRIPAQAECFTCHKNADTGIPIGPKPQNLNKTYDYADGTMNQLDKLIEQGYLEDNLPSDIVSTVDWKNPSYDMLERVRSYIDINCAHCHQENSHCDYRPMRFAYSETVTDENIGICVEPDEDINPILSHIVARGNSQKSVLYYRLNTTDEALRMPLLGRTLIHEEGLALIEEWIESIGPPCP